MIEAPSKRKFILENHSLTDKLSATQMGNMAKKYRIMYFEEPTAPHADNLAYVHEHTGIPVATGERMYSRWQFKDYLEKGAVQVIQPDLGTCGGITEVKKICDLAYIYEAAVQIHVCGSPLVTAASLQMEAAIPGFIIHEYNVNTEMPKMLGLTTQTYEPVDGKMPVPDLPGIGNEIAPDTFEHSEVIHVE
ncbi:MAG: enolase C-terminal domain-like protein [Chordicoccus sp.]